MCLDVQSGGVLALLQEKSHARLSSRSLRPPAVWSTVLQKDASRVFPEQT